VIFVVEFALSHCDFFQWKTILAAMMSRKRHCKATQLATPSSAGTAVNLRRTTPRGGQIGRGRYCRDDGSPMVLALQTPMYPPGNIIHIIRSHPRNSRLVCHRIHVHDDKRL